MGIYSKTHGVVEIQGKMIPVRYHHVDIHTIECVDEHGNEFLTHYKSLAVTKKGTE